MREIEILQSCLSFFAKGIQRRPRHPQGSQTACFPVATPSNSLAIVPLYTYAMCLHTPMSVWSARAPELSTCSRAARPLSDHGKWATGMRKKELLGSAIPARALYLCSLRVSGCED